MLTYIETNKALKCEYPLGSDQQIFKPYEDIDYQTDYKWIGSIYTPVSKTKIIKKKYTAEELGDFEYPNNTDCPHPVCTCSFKTEEELIKHIVGSHNSILPLEDNEDDIRTIEDIEDETPDKLNIKFVRIMTKLKNFKEERKQIYNYDVENETKKSLINDIDDLILKYEVKLIELEAELKQNTYEIIERYNHKNNKITQYKAYSDRVECF